MRRLVILGIIVVVLGVAWTAGWFALAGWVERTATTALARLEAQGLAIKCVGRRVTGFPFSLAIACTDAKIAERRTGSDAALAGITGGTSVFSPMTAKIALGSPAEADSPLLPGQIKATWSEAALNIGLGMGGPRTLSFGADDLTGALPDFSVAAARLRGMLAPAGAGANAEVSFEKLTLSRGGAAFPALDGQASGQLSAPPAALLAGAVRPPVSARAIRASLASGALRAQVEGEVSADAAGILDGAITLRVAGADRLAEFIASLPQDFQKFGNAVAGALLAFGRPATLDGAPASELLIEIKRGRAKVGPVEVRLPKLPV